jgi:hypothetical protein
VAVEVAALALLVEAVLEAVAQVQLAQTEQAVQPIQAAEAAVQIVTQAALAALALWWFHTQTLLRPQQLQQVHQL